jgi:hypothetical protein
MTQFDINQSGTTGLDTGVQDYTVPSESLDYADQETTYDFPNASEHIGFYKNVPELKSAIDQLAIWTCGKGFSTTPVFDVMLKSFSGWGEDTFDNIMRNMIVMKKVCGDSFAEVIRNDRGIPINLKPISPERMKVVCKGGRISRYEYSHGDGKPVVKFNREEILHLSNDRVGDEIHGTSSIDAVKWIIEARNEAMETYKKIMKRSLALGVLYVDTDDNDKLTAIKSKYKDAVNKGEVLVLPEGVAKLEDSKVSVQDFISWIQYLENFFYQAIKIPRQIVNSEGTEASSKVGFLTFEPVYCAEARTLEQDLLKQLGITIVFNKPPSLMDNVQSDEEKNTGQTGIQPKEAGVNLEPE